MNCGRPARPLSPGVQGLLSFEEPPEEPAAQAAVEGRSRVGPDGAPGAETPREPGPGRVVGRESDTVPADTPGRVVGRESDTVPADSPALVVRVLPDVVTLDKTFDYAVPDAWHADGRAERLTVGSIVRITLGPPPRCGAGSPRLASSRLPDVKLSAAGQRLTGMGPPADVDGAWLAGPRGAGQGARVHPCCAPASPPKRRDPPGWRLGSVADGGSDGLAAAVRPRRGATGAKSASCGRGSHGSRPRVRRACSTVPVP